MSEKAASGGRDGAKWPTYFRHFDDELQSHEAAHILAGKTPPSLIGCSSSSAVARHAAA